MQEIWKSTTKRDYDERMNCCPLCSSGDIGPYDHDFHGAMIEKCAGCGMKFMNPQHSDDYLRDLYGGYTELPSELADISSPKHDWRHSVHAYYLSLVENYTLRGRLLSVGSGDGVEIDAAQRQGWEVEAYEFDPSLCAFLADSLKVHTWAGNFPDITCESDHFDCVYLHHVLEHPKRPQDFIRTIHRILRPGGVLFVACPNIESPAARWKTLLGKSGLKKRRGRHYDTWHHLFYYSPNVLKRLLEERFDFDVVHIRNGLGEQMRGHSESSLRHAMAWDGIMPVWKSVFVLIAKKR
ncbi:MAG: class I SAM-dependent methyltransferase [Armatimonadetes bacterium]|nr:class I SAM-dependent methyltransferase [Armatimonadota bacterium]